MFLFPHIMLSALLSLALYPIFGAYSILVFVGGVFIDVDHYLEYVFRTKNTSLRKAYRNYMSMNTKYFDDLKKKRMPSKTYHLHAFHTIELLSAIVLISYFSKQYLFLYGVIFHMSLDTAYYFKNKILYKDLASLGRPVSLIHYLKNHSPSKLTKENTL